MTLEFIAMNRHIIKVTTLHGLTGVTWDKKVTRWGLPQVFGNKVVTRAARSKIYTPRLQGSHLY